MSRESLVEAVVKTAENLGWTEVLAEDSGADVQLLISAPGATEQIVEGPLHGLPKQLKDLGGPELYPSTEEYDALKDEFEDVVEHSNIVPEVHGPASEEKPPAEDTAETEAPIEDVTQGLAPQGDNGLSVARAHNAALQVGDKVIVTGVGRHSGPFRREFPNATEAVVFAEKCRAKAVNPNYAATIRVGYAQ